MTGAEHYLEAERQLGESLRHAEAANDQASDPDRANALVAGAMWYQGQAQVHATLALAAATALGSPEQSTWDYEAWDRAAGTPRPEPAP